MFVWVGVRRTYTVFNALKKEGRHFRGMIFFHVILFFTGMTPLLAAAVTGHNHIVEYLIKQPNLVSRKERIDALELLGATYVDKKRDMIGALELWRRALNDRYVSASTLMEKSGKYYRDLHFLCNSFFFRLATLLHYNKRQRLSLRLYVT